MQKLPKFIKTFLSLGFNGDVKISKYPRSFINFETALTHVSSMFSSKGTTNPYGFPNFDGPYLNWVPLGAVKMPVVLLGNKRFFNLFVPSDGKEKNEKMLLFYCIS